MSIFNMDEIKKEMKSADWQEMEPDREERRVFLGSVFALVPSGKYYMPWACSNVDVCAKCQEHEGTCGNEDCDGSCCEAHADVLWYASAESELSDEGYSLASGDGDPCDLFAVECRDIEPDLSEES
jgi:hypothetical protein